MVSLLFYSYFIIAVSDTYVISSLSAKLSEVLLGFSHIFNS